MVKEGKGINFIKQRGLVTESRRLSYNLPNYEIRVISLNLRNIVANHIFRTIL